MTNKNSVVGLPILPPEYRGECRFGAVDGMGWRTGMVLNYLPTTDEFLILDMGGIGGQFHESRKEVLRPGKEISRAILRRGRWEAELYLQFEKRPNGTALVFVQVCIDGQKVGKHVFCHGPEETVRAFWDGYLSWADLAKKSPEAGITMAQP
jgi:hypothetical protein